MFHQYCERTNEWRACLLDWRAFLRVHQQSVKAALQRFVTAFMLGALCAPTFSLPQNKGQTWGFLVAAHEKQTAQADNSQRKQQACSI